MFEQFGPIRRLRGRLSQMDSSHHAIAKGMAWVILFMLLGKLAGAAKEMAVAYRYGVSAEVDAYIFVLNLVSWPIGIWFSVLTVVLLPLAARIRQGATAQLPRFRSELLGLALVTGLTLAAFAWFGLPSLFRASWVGLPVATSVLALRMVPVLLLLIPLGIIVCVFSAWMLSAGRHANTLLEGVPALAIGFAVLAFPGGSIEPLVWGTLAGFCLHVVSLSIPLAWRHEIETPRFTLQSPYWSPFWKGFGIMLAGQVLMSFVGIIDPFFAAHLGPGAIATLSYANRILALILGLGATAVSRATLPVFSNRDAQGDAPGKRLAGHWVRLMFAVGILAMIVGWVFSPWAVRILFERGAFTPDDTVAVTGVLRYGLVQLPFYFSGMVLVSYVSSQRRYGVLFWTGVIGVTSKLVGNVVLIPWFGINGIAMAWGIVYVCNALFLWYAVGRSS